jgi:hypothetical protein
MFPGVDLRERIGGPSTSSSHRGPNSAASRTIDRPVLDTNSRMAQNAFRSVVTVGGGGAVTPSRAVGVGATGASILGVASSGTFGITISNLHPAASEEDVKVCLFAF